MAREDTRAPVVSFDDEPLVLVDAEDRVVGHGRKDEVHDGEGLLHRAFSVFLFDPAGRLLLQRRSADKRLWPGFWSNSCCSHPRRGEAIGEAAVRRVREELGVEAVLTYLFKFEYHARYGDRGSERELCSVYAGTTDRAPDPNPREIAEWAWVEVGEFERDLAASPERFTPWLRLEWPLLRQHGGEAVEALRG